MNGLGADEALQRGEGLRRRLANGRFGVAQACDAAGEEERGGRRGAYQDGGKRGRRTAGQQTEARDRRDRRARAAMQAKAAFVGSGGRYRRVRWR